MTGRQHGSWVALAALAIAASALAILTVRAARAPFDDVDLGWLVAAGRVILRTHAVPHVNGFAYTAPGTPWVMHEWLLGGAYAVLEASPLGLAFANVVAVLAATAIGAVVLALAVRDAPRPLTGLLFATALFAIGLERATSARPIGVALVFPLLFVWLGYRRRPNAVTLVLLELAWANIHGSFVLGPVLLAGAWAAERTPAHRRAFVLAALATLVSPYGLRLHRLVVGYALSLDPTLAEVRARVLEFAPIWRASYHVVVSPGELALVLVVVVLALRLRGARGTLALGFAALALLQARHVPLACLVGGALVLPALPARGPAVPLRFAPLTALLALVPGLASVRTPVVDPSLGGDAFVRLARELPPGARVFVPFRSGGLLLLVAGDRVTTFYDARNDCYPSHVAHVALALKDGELPPEGLGPLLLRYGTTAALVPRASYVRTTTGDARWSALAVLEPALGGWPVAAADGGWVRLNAPPAPPTPVAPTPGR